MQLEYLDALRRRSDAEIEEKLRSKPKLGSLPSQYSAPDKLEMASAILSGLRADKRSEHDVLEQNFSGSPRPIVLTIALASADADWGAN